jgi:hypothetical protein
MIKAAQPMRPVVLRQAMGMEMEMETAMAMETGTGRTNNLQQEDHEPAWNGSTRV